MARWLALWVGLCGAAAQAQVTVIVQEASEQGDVLFVAAEVVSTLPIVEVTAEVQGRSAALAQTATRYEGTIPKAGLAPGPWPLTVRATDTDGNMGEEVTSIDLAFPNPSMGSLTVVSPAPGARVPLHVPIEVRCSDGDPATLDRLEVRVSLEKVAEARGVPASPEGALLGDVGLAGIGELEGTLWLPEAGGRDVTLAVSGCGRTEEVTVHVEGDGESALLPVVVHGGPRATACAAGVGGDRASGLALVAAALALAGARRKGRRRGAGAGWVCLALALALLGGACVGPGSVVLSEGKGEANAEGLWPLRLGYRAGNLALVASAPAQRGRKWFAAVGQAGYLELEERTDGLYLAGSEVQGTLQEPVLLVPATVRVGKQWEARVPPARDQMPAVTNVDDESPYRFSVRGEATTLTPFGRRRVWTLTWEGPERPWSIIPTRNQDTDSSAFKVPRMRGELAFLEGVGPWPTLALPLGPLQGRFQNGWAAVVSPEAWAGVVAPAEDTPAGDGPPIGLSPMGAGWSSPDTDVRDVSVVEDSVGGRVATVSGFGAFTQGSSGMGSGGFSRRRSGACYVIDGGSLVPAPGPLAGATDDCLHGAAAFALGDGGFVAAPAFDPFGRLQVTSHSGGQVTSFYIHPLGFYPGPQDALHGVGFNRVQAGFGLHAFDPARLVTQVVYPSDRAPELLAPLQAFTRLFSRVSSLDVARTPEGLAMLINYAWPPAPVHALYAEDGSMLRMTLVGAEGLGHLSARYRPQGREVLWTDPLGLVRQLVLGPTGVTFGVVGRLQPPAGHRVRAAVRWDDERLLVVTQEGRGFVPLFETIQSDAFDVAMNNPGTGTAHAWLASWRAPADPAPAPAALGLRTNLVPGTPAKLRICAPDADGPLDVSTWAVGAVPAGATRESDVNCATVPLAGAALGEAGLSLTAPGLGAVRVGWVPTYGVK